MWNQSRVNGTRLSTAFGLLFAGGLYWLAVCELSATKEPWDSGAYWNLWYPVSLILSAASGYVLGKDGWMAGAILTVSQLPVLLIGGVTLLLIPGLLILCVLAIPATAISLLSGLIAKHVRPA